MYPFADELCHDAGDQTLLGCPRDSTGARASVLHWPRIRVELDARCNCPRARRRRRVTGDPLIPVFISFQQARRTKAS
jgi:hypothetical protein